MAALRALSLPAVEHDAVLDLVVQAAALGVAHRDDEVALLRREVLRRPRECAACARARDERVEVPVRLSPNLGARAVEVRVVVAAVLSAIRVRRKQEGAISVGASPPWQELGRSCRRTSNWSAKNPRGFVANSRSSLGLMSALSAKASSAVVVTTTDDEAVGMR